VYATLLNDGKADLFLTYCTNAKDAQRENAAFQMVRLPEELSVAADYGLTVMARARAAAYQLAMFILAAEPQRVLAKYGFAAPGLPQ
jgi:ABC-type molybdate transport system substrate-binding protein